MAQHTPLYSRHIDLGAQIIDFGGWDMPVHYGSQIDEHHHVRRTAGVFDVSHMTIVDITGADAQAFLARVLANDIGKLAHDGTALYSCMLNDTGGVIDDLITYRLAATHYRMIVNAATREADLNWLTQQASGFNVHIDERRDAALLSVQGPQAREAVAEVVGQREPILAIKPFGAAHIDGYFIARTGYTGEDGLEVMLPADRTAEFWDALLAHEVKPCGLGARDTLRLEAGLNLYGQDMDTTITPLEAGLGWTVDWRNERNFIGRQALENLQEAGVATRFVGLVLQERGILRPGQTVHVGDAAGVVTSGSFSPTLKRSIGLARVPRGDADTCQITLRGKQKAARIVKPPFVRRGDILINLD